MYANNNVYAHDILHIRHAIQPDASQTSCLTDFLAQVTDMEEQKRLLRRLERGIPALCSGVSNDTNKAVIAWDSASLRDGGIFR